MLEKTERVCGNNLNELALIYCAYQIPGILPLLLHMNRILIYAIILALVLMLFGANEAAGAVLDTALIFVKWVFILFIGGGIVYFLYERFR